MVGRTEDGLQISLCSSPSLCYNINNLNAKTPHIGFRPRDVFESQIYN